MSEIGDKNEYPIIAVKDKAKIKSHIRIHGTGETLGNGVEGTVKRVTVVSERAKERPITLVHKEFHTGKSAIVPYERIFENYTSVKKAGLPVPRTFRGTEDQKGILITDLSKDGQNVVLSINDIEIKKIRDLYGKNSITMDSFTHGEAVGDVTEQTDTLIHKATEAGLMLHADAWFVIVKPDGSYDFVVGDFGRIATRREVEERRHKEITNNELFEMNKNAFDYARSRIGLIQQYGTHPQAVVSALSSE